MIDLEWDEVYEIGVDFIDSEHKAILSVMREIQQAVLNGDLQACAELSDGLIDLASSHFAHEESYLAQVGFPRLDQHKIYHEELLNQAKRVKAICEGAEETHSLEECFYALEKFLVDDVINGDFDFRSYLEFHDYAKLRRA